jgi:hypothetical protein
MKLLDEISEFLEESDKRMVSDTRDLYISRSRDAVEQILDGIKELKNDLEWQKAELLAVQGSEFGCVDFNSVEDEQECLDLEHFIKKLEEL